MCFCFFSGCEPYSEAACEAAAKKLGYAKGSTAYPFKSEYHTKGCYAYDRGDFAGQVYYGTGGTKAQMKEIPKKEDQYRPQGYDCSGQAAGKGNDNLIWIQVYFG